METYFGNLCRVCGLTLGEPPWGHDGQSPTFDFCDCCSCEFGYQDCTAAAAQMNRERWIAAGARWDRPERMPAGWNLDEQLKALKPES